MILHCLNQFQYENTYSIISSIQFQITCLIVGLLQVLLVNIFTNREKIHNIFLGLHSSFQSKKSSKTHNALVIKENKFKPSVNRCDLEIVLENLGVFCNSEKLPTNFDANDIYTLFDEKNISLDEVKEAFDMFDKNKDGFIDAGELQMVLRALGLREGSDMENCRTMIRKSNKHGDEKMGFEDFVKFMEISLS